MNKKLIKSVFMDSPEVLASMEDSYEGDNAFLERLKALLRGEAGYTPIKGKDYFTPQEIKQFKEEILKGATPVKFKDYFTEKEIVYIMGEVKKLVHADITDNLKKELTPRKGIDYVDGKDGQDADEVAIVSEVLRKIPKQKELTAQDIASKVNTLKEAIDPEAIKGYLTLDGIVKEIKKKKLIDKRDITGLPINMNDMRWHGGGLSTVAHDATLSGDGTAASPLTVISSGGLTKIVVTGSVNGVNQTFTAVGSLPKWLVIDGAWYEQKDSNNVTQWSAVGLVITTNITPNSAIWGF